MQILTLENLQYFKEKSDEAYIKKEAGKGLSTNDYTDADKEAIAALVAAGGGLEAVDNAEIDKMF